MCKYEDDIKDIDCGDSQPKGTQIQNGDKKSCWIYVVDETVNKK